MSLTAKGSGTELLIRERKSCACWPVHGEVGGRGSSAVRGGRRQTHRDGETQPNRDRNGGETYTQGDKHGKELGKDGDRDQERHTKQEQPGTATSAPQGRHPTPPPTTANSQPLRLSQGRFPEASGRVQNMKTKVNAGLAPSKPPTSCQGAPQIPTY